MNYALRSSCSSASILSAYSIYARIDATSGPLFTVLCYTESARFSTWTVEGIACRRARRSGGWLEACWRVDGSGWVYSTAGTVWSCAGWFAGMIERVGSCSDHSTSIGAWSTRGSWR